MGTHICQYEIIQTSAAPVCGGTGAVRVAQQMAAVETINQLNAQARLDPSWRAHAVGFRLPMGAWSQIRLNVGVSSLDCSWSARRQITSEPHHADALDCARPLLLT